MKQKPAQRAAQALYGTLCWR